MNDEIKFTITCPACGHQLQEVNIEDEGSDALALCVKCNAELANYEELKRELMAKAEAEISKMVQDTFKSSSFKLR